MVSTRSSNGSPSERVNNLFNEFQRKFNAQKNIIRNLRTELRRVTHTHAALQVMECGLCFNEMNQTHVLIPCGHAICHRCIAHYIANANANCPYCNQAVGDEVLVYFMQPE